MTQLIERSFRERIVIVGVITQDVTDEEVQRSLDELALLIDTAGADVVARVVQRRDTLDPATFVGSGKAQEIRDISYEVDADTVVFDEELTPAQQRNLEKIFGRTAIDRTAVILDIFAQNAHTQEGKAQVELALLRYRLPRLRGRGTTLSQQGGGIGTRGPGETQLEVDRRRLLRRITALEAELRELRKLRNVQRRARERGRRLRVSLVGYTNAGKSTLLNAILQSGAPSSQASERKLAATENRLFSTLDPITRQGQLPGGEVVLFSDTVGFVRKLPHQLVEAFRSTLDEVNDADVLVHVVDASGPEPEENIAAVHAVLDEIATSHLPELLVFNKVDRLTLSDEVTTTPSLSELDVAASASTTTLSCLLRNYPGAIVVSALHSQGMDELLAAIAQQVRTSWQKVTLHVPFARGDVLSLLYREAEVVTKEEKSEYSEIVARMDAVTSAKLAEFILPQRETDGDANSTDVATTVQRLRRGSMCRKEH